MRVGGVVLGSVLLAGIAAPAMAAVPDSAATTTSHAALAAATHDGSVKSASIPVFVQLENVSSAPVTLDIDANDHHQRTTLDSGDIVSVGGQSTFGHNIDGTMTYANGTKVSFWVNDPWIGAPTVGFGNSSNWDRYDEPQDRTKVENGHAYKVHRFSDVWVQTISAKVFKISMVS